MEDLQLITLPSHETDFDLPNLVDNDAMEIKLFLIGPKDEKNLDECLEGRGYELHANTIVVEHEVAEHMLEDHINRPVTKGLGSLLCPVRRGQRSIRRRGTSWGVKLSHLFGSQSPFTSYGVKYRTRKNNDHWTQDEMRRLVQSVSKIGLGKWSKVKEDHFATSIRKAVHLKDKWRNLVKACRANATSRRRKVKVQEATELIVQEFKHRILVLEAGKDLPGKRK